MTLENASISTMLRNAQSQIALDAQYQASTMEEPPTLTPVGGRPVALVVLDLVSSGSGLKWKVVNGGIWVFREGARSPF